MVIAGTTRRSIAPRYGGLRMSADDYLELRDDGYRYELINGVVLMSPSPSFGHQRVGSRIVRAIGDYIEPRKLGEVVYETDVRFAPDLVYRPDIVFYAAARVAQLANRLDIPPDLVIELASPSTEPMDLRTKRDDYERYGVREYWVIGPDSAHQFVLESGRFVEKAIKNRKIVSVVLGGFSLDLAQVCRGISFE